MSLTKFRVSEPWGVCWRKSLWALSHQWVGQGIHSIVLEMFFCKYEIFYQGKKKAKSGVGSIFGLLLCLKQCSFPTKQHPDGREKT